MRIEMKICTYMLTFTRLVLESALELANFTAEQADSSTDSMLADSPIKHV